MVAVEKGLQEKAASLTPLKVAGIFKDVMNRLDVAANYFEDAISKLTSSARSDFLTYYVTYCKGMKTYYEVGSLVGTRRRTTTTTTPKASLKTSARCGWAVWSSAEPRSQS